jgi:hypothetical protein
MPSERVIHGIRVAAGIVYMALMLAMIAAVFLTIAGFVTGFSFLNLLLNPHIGVPEAVFKFFGHWWMKCWLGLAAFSMAVDVCLRMKRNVRNKETQISDEKERKLRREGR